MRQKDMSSFKTIALIFTVFIVSLVLGLVIGAVTFDWWYEIMFGGPNGAVVLGLIALVVAFLVPFFITLVAQICILLFLKKKNEAGLEQ